MIPVTEMSRDQMRAIVANAMWRAAGDISVTGCYALAEYQGDLCFVPWCDLLASHLDHRVPVRHGGRSDMSNLQWLCATHNHRKRARMWPEFISNEGRWERQEGLLWTEHNRSSDPIDTV